MTGIVRAMYVVGWGLWTGASVANAGCATTRFHERERLSAPCMQADHDQALTFLRTKAEGAREAGFGGYGRSPAGGCGCE